MAPKAKAVSKRDQVATKKLVIANRLKEIERQHGIITADLVLADAQNPASPLHGEFNWDDKSAAHAHRLDTARKLIADVQYVYRVTKQTISSVYYIRDPRSAPKQGYVSIETLQTDPAWAREALDFDLKQALGRLDHAREFAKVLGLEDVFENAVAELIKLQVVAAA